VGLENGGLIRLGSAPYRFPLKAWWSRDFFNSSRAASLRWLTEALSVLERKVISNLVARVVEMGDRAAKAAILHLNWAASPVGEMEEAMVVRGAVRDVGTHGAQP